MRHPEPQVVKDYWQQQNQSMPRCCHTCDHYKEDGLCESYEMRPPLEFTQAVGKCERWLDLIPF